MRHLLPKLGDISSSPIWYTYYYVKLGGGGQGETVIPVACAIKTTAHCKQQPELVKPI